MFVVGLLLVLLGALAIVCAIFGSEGTAAFLSFDVSAFGIFLIGLAAGVAILWGYSIAKYGLPVSVTPAAGPITAASARSAACSSSRSVA